MEICEMLHVPEERVHVVYCGIADDFSHAEESAANDAGILTGLGVDGPFLLSVGALEPRKNLDRALEAFAVLRGQPQFRDMRLVHVGPEGWLSSHVPALVRSLGIESDVRFLGVVPRPALAALYRAARVTVYVSLYEGFGLPVAESMACGTPVVTSNRSSMPEVAGGAALLVDPLSIDSIVQGIASAWSDEELRRTLRSRGLARARAFDWSNAAGETARVYERVLELRAA
jgi:glycosyltransferase involved in cell wall biosynthesis